MLHHSSSAASEVRGCVWVTHRVPMSTFISPAAVATDVAQCAVPESPGTVPDIVGNMFRPFFHKWPKMAFWGGVFSGNFRGFQLLSSSKLCLAVHFWAIFLLSVQHLFPPGLWDQWCRRSREPLTSLPSATPSVGRGWGDRGRPGAARAGCGSSRRGWTAGGGRCTRGRRGRCTPPAAGGPPRAWGPPHPHPPCAFASV